MMDRGCCGKERAQYKSKAAALSVNQHSYPYPCIWVLGTDLRNEKETLVYTKCGRTLTWRQSEEFSHLKGVQSKATASPHWKKPIEVMRACFEEEALGQTQDSLQRLYLSGLETTWSSSKLAGGGSQGEVWAAVWLCLGCHTCDPNSDNWQEMVK